MSKNYNFCVLEAAINRCSAEMLFWKISETPRRIAMMIYQSNGFFFKTPLSGFFRGIFIPLSNIYHGAFL